MQTEIQEDKLIEMALWLTDHPKIQRRLCDGEYEVSPEEFLEIMEQLENKGFYELIYILLIKNQYNDVLEQAATSLLIQKAGKEWQRIGTKEMCRDFKEKIQGEIRRKAERRSRF